MDRPTPNDSLGVKKTGKNVKKSSANAQTQPKIYMINKSEFKSRVQELIGPPPEESVPQPPRNKPPKPQNTRLQRMRPPPLTQINRPAVPLPAMAPPQSHPQFATQPSPLPPFPQGIQQPFMGHGNQLWPNNIVESPVSAYMRYLQSSLGDSGPNGNQMQPGYQQPPNIPGHEQQGPYIQGPNGNQMQPGHQQPPYIPGHEQQEPYIQEPNGNQVQPGHEQGQYVPNHQQQPSLPGHQPQPSYIPGHEQQWPYIQGPNGNQVQPGHEQGQYVPNHQQQPSLPGHQPQPYVQGHQPQPYVLGHQQGPYVPSHVQQTYMPAEPQPHKMPGWQSQVNMHAPLQPNQYLPPPRFVPSPVPHNLPSPRFNAPAPVNPTPPSPSFSQMLGGILSPGYNGFGPLPSPTSQFLLPSPTGYQNMFSPRSPYPLLSPRVQYPQPHAPNFSLSQTAPQGSLGPSAGPGPGPFQPPPSPGQMFPLSPSGFLPLWSPRWNDN